MTRIRLIANSGNEHIDALLAAGDVHLDGLKVGPWQGDEQIAAVASAHPVLLHISDGVVWPTVSSRRDYGR